MRVTVLLTIAEASQATSTAAAPALKISSSICGRHYCYLYLVYHGMALCKITLLEGTDKAFRLKQIEVAVANEGVST